MTADPKWDAVVVGAGAGGAAAAYGLSKRGLSVLLLDAGPHFDPLADYPQTDGNTDIDAFPEKPGSTYQVSLAPGQTLAQHEPLLASGNRGWGDAAPTKVREMYTPSHVRGIGGTTLHFTGESQRLHPAALKLRSRFGAGADWPIDYADLEPFYGEAERLVGVAGEHLASDPRWRSQPFPLPAHPLSWAAQTLGKGAAALGLGWRANSRAALSLPYADRASCNYCGGCIKGCPRGDKGSADVTFVAAALATGRCTVRADAPVVRIERAQDDRVAAVHVGRPDGGLERVAAPLLVLAAGAVESPRLLLASELGNESGEVGRNLMEGLSVLVGALHPEPQHGRRGLPCDAICWNFSGPDAIAGTVGGCRFVNASAEAGHMALRDFALRAVPGWGREHAAAMRKQWGHALHVGGHAASDPNRATLVALDTDKRDRFGVPLARISAHLGDGDLVRLRFMAAKARAILAACGATDLFESYSSWDEFRPSTVLGTCRMGTDPRSSVVRADLRSHRWRNLWITDASVFPSAGCEAPSLTIHALALRAAAAIG